MGYNFGRCNASENNQPLRPFGALFFLTVSEWQGAQFIVYRSVGLDRVSEALSGLKIDFTDAYETDCEFRGERSRK